MKKLLATVLCITLVFAITGCGSKADTPEAEEPVETAETAEDAGELEADSTTIEGMWAWCGYVEEGKDLSSENVTFDEEFMDETDLEDVLNSSLVITENGMADSYEGMQGCTIGDRKNTANGFTQDVTITEVDQAKVDEPIIITYTVSLIDGLLYIQEGCSDKTYTTSDVNVFKKVMD